VRTILHISDVHFGPPHLPRLAEGVLELAAERHPSLVVVSGDLTQRALPEQFRQARAFVDRFAAPVLAVPGNHDVPFHKPPHRLWMRFLAPFRQYRRHFSPELEPIYRDDEMIVVGINTAFGWTLKDGRIKLRRLLELGELLAGVPEPVFKVVVAHHHLIPPPNFGSQRVLTNAYEAIDLFSSVGVDLILSGHQHQSYIGNSEEFYPKGRPPVVLLHSGTTTSNRGRGSERDKNTCNWIEIGARSLIVSQLRWHPELDRFAEQSRHWYPRQEVTPYTLEEVTAPPSEELAVPAPSGVPAAPAR
jgi:3',5'-cyclic AMP phosphodiesterase CpdA